MVPDSLHPPKTAVPRKGFGVRRPVYGIPGSSVDPQQEGSSTLEVPKLMGRDESKTSETPFWELTPTGNPRMMSRAPHDLPPNLMEDKAPPWSKDWGEPPGRLGTKEL